MSKIQKVLLATDLVAMFIGGVAAVTVSLLALLPHSFFNGGWGNALVAGTLAGLSYGISLRKTFRGQFLGHKIVTISCTIAGMVGGGLAFLAIKLLVR